MISCLVCRKPKGGRLEYMIAIRVVTNCQKTVRFWPILYLANTCTQKTRLQQNMLHFSPEVTMEHPK